MKLDEFFSSLWKDYTEISPQAEQIRQLFLKTDPEVVNDHVAFRTFSDCPLDLGFLASIILSLGYEVQDHYNFGEKKLKATSFIHKDVRIPKIFVSELERHRLSSTLQGILSQYCNQIAEVESRPEVFWSGRHWPLPSLQDYRTVLKESEYAAWLLVIGLRVNHFTVSVDLLQSTDDIREVLQRVQDAGYAINEVGGRVKGTPKTLLEQGSTMADQIEIVFDGGEKHCVPSCFYEFAKRHKNTQGELYQGFITANADKIFESTFTQ